MKTYSEQARHKHKALVCKTCGESYIGHHLSRECDSCYLRPCVGCGAMLTRSHIRTNKNYCTPECKANNPTANKMSLDKRVKGQCPCGTSFLRYVNGSRREYCSTECRWKYQRQYLRDNPEFAREIASRPKPNHGLRGYKQTLEHLMKRVGDGSIRPSKGELALVEPLAKLGFRHTGDGSRWMTWHDGSHHNPDFVNEETRQVVEYFGTYWHRDDAGREGEIKQAWADIGYDCTIIWEGSEHDLSIIMQR